MNVFHNIKLSAAGDLHFFERVWLLREKIAEIMPDVWLSLDRRALLRDRWSKYMLERRSLLGCLPKS
jgi:hypothetical protein